MNTEHDWEELVIDDTVYPTRLTEKYRNRKAGVIEDARIIRAAVPGKILTVIVEPGQAVERGQALLILEAMKMENTILSCTAGSVGTVHVSPGTLVAKGDLLVELDGE